MVGGSPYFHFILKSVNNLSIEFSLCCYSDFILSASVTAL